MRARMVEALAAFLGIEHERASAALDHVWEATKDDGAEAPPSWQPDLDDPAQALAHRVQLALEREFAGEPLFPTCVLVEDPDTRRIGLAATALAAGEIESFLLLGRGMVRRVLRQHEAS